MKMLPKLHPLLKQDLKAGKGIKIENNEISANIGKEFFINSENKLELDYDNYLNCYNKNGQFVLELNNKRFVFNDDVTEYKGFSVISNNSIVRFDRLVNGYKITNNYKCVIYENDLKDNIYTGSSTNNSLGANDTIISVDFSKYNLMDNMLPDYTFVQLLEDWSALETVKFPYIQQQPLKLTKTFNGCNSLKYVDLQYVHNIEIGQFAFKDCNSLKYIRFSSFTSVDFPKNSFACFLNCKSLNHIVCTQELKDNFIAHASQVFLPKSMLPGGNGIWEIID